MKLFDVLAGSARPNVLQLASLLMFESGVELIQGRLYAFRIGVSRIHLIQERLSLVAVGAIGIFTHEVAQSPAIILVQVLPASGLNLGGRFARMRALGKAI